MKPGTVSRSIDVIARGADPSPLVRRMAERLDYDLRHHVLGSGSFDRSRLSGLMIILDVGPADAAALLLISAIRSVGLRRILVLLPSPDPRDRHLARLHGADHVADPSVDEDELATIVRNELQHDLGWSAHPRLGEEQLIWRLHADRWSLFAPNGREIRLCRSEYNLLDLFISQAGSVHPRRLLRTLIDGDFDKERVLDVTISRLRRKVWDCSGMELPLRCARGCGYVFARPTSAHDGFRDLRAP